MLVRIFCGSVGRMQGVNRIVGLVPSALAPVDRFALRASLRPSAERFAAVAAADRGPSLKAWLT